MDYYRLSNYKTNITGWSKDTQLVVEVTRQIFSHTNLQTPDSFKVWNLVITWMHQSWCFQVSMTKYIYSKYLWHFTFQQRNSITIILQRNSITINPTSLWHIYRRKEVCIVVFKLWSQTQFEQIKVGQKNILHSRNTTNWWVLLTMIDYQSEQISQHIKGLKLESFYSK